MRSKMSPLDQARLGAAAGGVLLLWTGGGGFLILTPLGVVLLIKGAWLAGGLSAAIGVALLIAVIIRHIRIIKRDQSEDAFFPE